MKPTNQIRLTIETGAREFGMDRRTLRSRLTVAAILPGEDGKYSIGQLAKAIFSDLQAERTRLTKEQADIAEVKKANLLRENIPTAMVVKVWSSFVIDLRQKILLSELSDAAKRDILHDLQSIPVENYFEDSKLAVVHDPDAEGEPEGP